MHNVLHFRQRMNEPRLWVRAQKSCWYLYGGLRYASGQTDRHVDRVGSEVITKLLYIEPG